MVINHWLKVTSKSLLSNNISTARLDTELLLADALNKNRPWILAHPEHELTDKQMIDLDEKIRRRADHEPIAYIRGKQEFYGREFSVSPATLTPRPETETMVEMLLNLIGNRQFTTKSELQVIDVGTGSGCIAISVALELAEAYRVKPTFSFSGLDNSEPALKIARRNAEKFKVDINFTFYDLLKDPLPIESSALTLITANLPYVPDDFHINLAATHEPAQAIFGGQDGLDYYRELFRQLHEKPGCIVFTESLPPQHKQLANIAKEAGFDLIESQDLIQVFS